MNNSVITEPNQSWDSFKGSIIKPGLIIRAEKDDDFTTQIVAVFSNYSLLPSRILNEHTLYTLQFIIENVSAQAAITNPPMLSAGAYYLLDDRIQSHYMLSSRILFEFRNGLIGRDF